jgi:hypothetical protein
MKDEKNPHAIDVESADYMHTSYEKDPSLELEKKRKPDCGVEGHELNCVCKHLHWY